MAVLLDPGGSATYDFSLWPGGTSGSPTVVSDIVHGQPRSLRAVPSATPNYWLDDTVGGSHPLVKDSGTRLSWYMYIAAFPTTTRDFLVLINNSASQYVFHFSMDNFGNIYIYDYNGLQIGGNGGPVSTGQWYHMTFSYKITSVTVNSGLFTIDGVSNITFTNYSFPNTAGTSMLWMGNIAGDTAFDFRVSDFYMDNDTGVNYPGDVIVTAKRPNANGTTNGFTTQIGAGGSGYGSGHSPQVNERPQSDTNGWSMVGAGAAITEEYAIENRAAGDADLTNYNIIDFMGWVRAKSLISETASIIVAGTASNISLTSAIAYFIKFTGSAIYPAGATDIGIITDTTLTTVSLYECGIVMACSLIANNYAFLRSVR